MKPTPAQLQALSALRDVQPATAAEWMRAAALPERTFFHALAALVKGGWVGKGGQGRGAVYAAVNNCKITAKHAATVSGEVLFADLVCMAADPRTRNQPAPRPHLHYITTVYGVRVRWTGRILNRTDEVRYHHGKVFIPAVCLHKDCRMVTEYEVVPPAEGEETPATRPRRRLAPGARERLASRRPGGENG